VELAPIVLFAYNRPKHTMATLQALKNCELADKSVLYVFADGVKNNDDESEMDAVSRTRGVIESDKWCAKTIIHESIENKGLADSIITGITQVCEKHGRVIVLEDDIVVSPFFLQYMNDALDFYENEKKVWHIAGYALPFYEQIDGDTFFSKFMSCWGWATWYDRWKYFKKDPKAALAKAFWKKYDFTYGNKYKSYWQIRANLRGKRNTWAAFWYATIYFNNGLCLNPRISFADNIGMDGSGAHCKTSTVYKATIGNNYPIMFETRIGETPQTRRLFMENLSKKTKKLICLKPNGQYSNRLIQNLNFEAFCMEYGYDFQNPTLVDIAGFYLSPCNVESVFFINLLRINFLGRMFRHAKIVKKLFSSAWLISKLGLIKYVDFDRGKREKNGERTLLKAFEKHDTVFVSGWYFRVPELVEKHRAELVKRYSLRPKLYENNDFYKKIIELKREGNTLVGVHIRRGDYKKWENGKYYFDDDTYKAYIDAFSQKLLKEGVGKIVVLIFSNEKVDFTEAPNLMVSKESWFIDHHIMSLCDYLIGPPSTFTLWASYIGKNTLFYIHDKDGTLKNMTSDFRENDLFHIGIEITAANDAKPR